MKPKLAALAAVLACAPAFAGGGFVARGGLNIANATLKPSGGVESSSRAGLEAGALADFAPSNNVHLLIGLLFDQKGFSWSDDNGNDADVRLNYLTIPVMLSFRAASAEAQGNAVPFFNAGVELSPLKSAIIETGGSKDDYTDATGFDFGLRGEVGLEIPASAGSGTAFLLGAGYSYGLVNSNDMDSNLDPPEQHNYAIKIFAGVKFGAPSAAVR